MGDFGNTFKIDQIIMGYLRQFNLDKDYAIRMSWEKVVGSIFSSETRIIGFRNGVSNIECKSSVIKSELVMMKTKIIGLLNDEIGGDIVRNIMFK